MSNHKYENAEKKKARQARYRERKRAEREAREMQDTITSLNEQLAEQKRLTNNINDPIAPLDLDHFVRSADMFDKPQEMARTKRQEYNSLQGAFADFLADPTSKTPEEARQLARYGAGLTEDEARFTRRRFARFTAIQSAREALFLRMFTARATQIFADKIVPSGFAREKPCASSNRIINLHLSDLHVGAKLDRDEFPVESNASMEARRIAALVLQTAEFKTQYRERTRLHVYLNGDMIAGLLRHSYANEEDALADQFVGVTHMLCQALCFLAKHYPEVVVFCQSGNHGRNIQVHPGRATAQKWDSFETMIYVSIAIACQPLQNVRFEIPKTPYCNVPLFDQWALMTHGDTTVNVGNPAAKVNVDGILKQVNSINASNVYGRHYSVVIVGHVHTAMTLDFPGGTLLVNGAGTPPNGHALSLGFFPACAQWLWESVPDHAVGDMRLIRLNSSVDNDADLEKVIKPVRYSDGTWTHSVGLPTIAA